MISLCLVNATSTSEATPGRRSDRGQVLVIFALAADTSLGMAALAIDADRDRSVQEVNQGYADGAVRSAAHLWGTELTAHGYTGLPASASSDPAIILAQQLTGIDGVSTIASSQCTTETAVVYYNTVPSACPAAPSGWTNRVEVDVPPAVTTGCAPQVYDCISVTVTQVLSNLIVGVMGFRRTTVLSTAIGLATTQTFKHGASRRRCWNRR